MKPGDRVRIIHDAGRQFLIGCEGVVLRADGSSLPYLVKVERLDASPHGNWFYPNELELISAPESEPKILRQAAVILSSLPDPYLLPNGNRLYTLTLAAHMRSIADVLETPPTMAQAAADALRLIDERQHPEATKALREAIERDPEMTTLQTAAEKLRALELVELTAPKGNST